MTVDLRPVDGSSDLLDVWADGRLIGLVRLTIVGLLAKVTAQLNSAPTYKEDIGAFVVAMVERAGHHGADDVELQVESLLVRDAARRVGFRGHLRVPLTARVADVGSAEMPDDLARVPTRRDRLAMLVAALEDLGVASTAVRPARALGKITKRLAGGVGEPLEVVIEWTPGRTFIISAPDRFDIMPESIALAGDTAAAVLNRFPRQAIAVEYIYFDRAIYGLKTGRFGGMTEGSAPAIHMNAGYASFEANLELMRQRDSRTPKVRSAGPPTPYTVVDATVAHELWHKIEMVYEARNYRSSIEFRRQLGLHLGVETLEHAIKGGTDKAPATWRLAYSRLAGEVSSYATTSPREATAEMFKLWWCRGSSTTPVVARFGELMDEFLPR